MADSFEGRLARAREEEAARRRALEDEATANAQVDAAAKAYARERVDEVRRAAGVLAACPIPSALLEAARRYRYDDDGLAAVQPHSGAFGYVFKRRTFGRIEFVAFRDAIRTPHVYITLTGDIRLWTLDEKRSLEEFIDDGT